MLTDNTIANTVDRHCLSVFVDRRSFFPESGFWTARYAVDSIDIYLLSLPDAESYLLRYSRVMPLHYTFEEIGGSEAFTRRVPLLVQAF